MSEDFFFFFLNKGRVMLAEIKVKRSLHGLPQGMFAHTTEQPGINGFGQLNEKQARERIMECLFSEVLNRLLCGLSPFSFKMAFSCFVCSNSLSKPYPAWTGRW